MEPGFVAFLCVFTCMIVGFASYWIGSSRGYVAGVEKGERYGMGKGREQGWGEQMKAQQKDMISRGLAYHDETNGGFCWKTRREVAMDFVSELSEDVE